MTPQQPRQPAPGPREGDACAVNDELKAQTLRISDSVTLILGDCRDVLPSLRVDATVTDPPYGVNLGNHGAAKDRRVNRVLVKDGYGDYDDTPENYDAVVVPAIKAALAVSKRALVFCAMPQGWKLPVPDAMGGVYLPSGCGRNKWGFNCLAHYLLYGQAPALNLGAKPTSFESTATAEHKDHPCPKPVPWMVRAVMLASVEGETVLDPFMGSGTTGIACIRTGRKFIGIEFDPKHFQTAVERIQRELSQGVLSLGGGAERVGEQLDAFEHSGVAMPAHGPRQIALAMGAV